MDTKRIQFALINGNDRYLSINIPHDEKVWDEIIERYLPKPLPVQMAEKGTIAGMFGVNSRYRDGMD